MLAKNAVILTIYVILAEEAHMKITKKKLQEIINEELKNALSEADLRDPMSPTGEAPSEQVEMLDKVKDNLTHAIWLLEHEEEMSRDVLILIDGAHRRALELMGMDSNQLPYNM